MNIKDIPKGLLGTVSSILEKKTVKEVDEPAPEGEKSFKNFHLRDLEVSQFIEKLDPKSDVSDWIEDFMKSDAPQFKGKSKEERKKMALAAYYSAREKAGLEEAGPRWMPDEPDDQIPSGNWYGPKADAELVVWLKKRLKAKPRDKKYVDKLLKYIHVQKSFWKKFYEGADKDVKGEEES